VLLSSYDGSILYLHLCCTGSVAKWNSGGGWGFIRPDDSSVVSSGDLFVHNTALVSQNKRYLVRKERVDFKLGGHWSNRGKELRWIYLQFLVQQR
jgi:cold shock CspA family protein